MHTDITGGKVARYMFLPGILPRTRKLLSGGFGNLAFYIAMVFNTLRIIPDTHPYVQPYNRRNFSVLQVLGVAADHIKFDRKNLDKAILFFVVLGGMVMLFAQMVLGLLAIIANPAFAYDGPAATHNTLDDFFGNQNTETDLAFRLLDLIFGIPDIFKSQDMGTQPFHEALHALFAFYSYGVLLVGVIVILYLVIAIVLETAQTGVPFGERFSGWAPVRLVLFLGLLLPAGSGINLAQYIVLEAARLGSNLATNAWITFDEGVKNTPYLGEPKELIAKPIPPDLGSLVSFMQLAKTCSWAEGRVNGRDIQIYAVFDPKNDAGNDSESIPFSESAPSYTKLSSKADGGTIRIRFGEKDEKYKKEDGSVYPYCGELTLTVVDNAQPGATLMQQAYLELVSCLWNGTRYKSSGESALGDSPFCKNTLSNMRGKNYSSRYSVLDPENPFPDMTYTEWNNATIAEMRIAQLTIANAVDEGRDKQVEEGEWTNEPALEMGWAGAGIWFNKIAEQNGAFTSSIYAKPEIRLLPYVMEYIREIKSQNNPNTPVETLYVPVLADGRAIPFEEPQQREVLLILNQLFTYWGTDRTVNFVKSIPETHSPGMTGNIIIDVMNTFLGTRGLFDMCKNTDVHPLAQLASIGKGMVEHSIRGFAMAAGTGIGGGILQMLGQAGFASVLTSATSFFIGFASLGLMIGVLLFYVIPFLPFIYFFFAVMTWAKGIFEAMVGAPLWALAHLRIDGEGLPGQRASQGYYHVMEIFLRPVCIIIGFLGAIVIFSAMVKVLNQIFYLVISNITGHYVGEETGCFAPPVAEGAGEGGGQNGNYPTEDEFLGGTIDEFFYTVMYAIIVYLFAIPSFKLVDLIPDTIMRWFSNVQPFGAMDGDPAADLMTHVTVGAGLVGGKLQGGLQSAFSSFGMK